MVDHGVISSDDATAMLRELGFNDHDSAALLALGTAQRVTAHKRLTRADIVTMYEDGLLPRKDSLDRLVALGYDQTDATEMLDLADVKARAAFLKTTQRGIEAALKAHHITQAQAISQLNNAGMDHTQASNLVDLWLQQRGTPVRALTEAQVIRIVKAQLITPADAVNRLMAIGLSQGDATLLLESYIGAF
jgi:hypothetical protein